jgi:hypothetical protein
LNSKRSMMLSSAISKSFMIKPVFYP